MIRRIPIACLCLVVLLSGCTEKKKEAWQKREQVYSDKTPQEWLTLIQHRDVRVRNRAVDALVQYEKQGRHSVPALIEILATARSGDVRLSVARALGAVGAPAKAAVPALVKALKDSRWDQRDGAAEALGEIGQDLARTTPALVEALQDRDERVRGKAAQALGRIRSADLPVVSALAAALEDEDVNVKAYAAEALQRIGPEAKAAVPALEKAAESEDFVVAQAAAEALKGVRGR